MIVKYREGWNLRHQNRSMKVKRKCDSGNSLQIHSCLDRLIMQMKYETGTNNLANNEILGKPLHFVETPTRRIR